MLARGRINMTMNVISCLMLVCKSKSKQKVRKNKIEIMELEKIKYQIMSAKIKETGIKLSGKQQEAYNAMVAGKSVFVTGSAGVGKCLGVDTPVIMYNGTVKKIQNIKTGELVMGDDSTPRKVLSTATGKDIMYQILTATGDSYIVNSAHILTFKASKTIRYKKSKRKYVLTWGDKSGNVKSKHFEKSESAHSFMKTLPDLIDIPIMECMEKNKYRHWREYFQGVYKELYFPEQKVNLDPYILGLWLGDGATNKPVITATDDEIIFYLEKFAEKNMYRLEQCKKGTKDGINYRINDDQFCKNSRFIKILREYNVWDNKHIPHVYKVNSRANRLSLLAGLLDSDGYLCESGSTFEITQKRETLARDIYFLAKSLGYQVSVKSCEKSCVYKGEKRVGTYWRLFISGNTDEIPVLIKRKKAQPRKQIKNHMVSRIKIKELGEGDYYGFELDGNHRFLLGNFLVTHNTALIKTFIEVYGQNKIIGVTSMTGISAVLFGGTTLHSFLGIGLGTASVEDLVSKIFKRSYLRKRWCELETLIIDEISMLSPVLFDKLEEISRTVRHDDRSFGGIQLILSGDFCFSEDTPILMSSGSIKMSQNISIGDSIMGDDSKPRKVCRLYQGKAPMYKISFPQRGEDLTVTGNHILCLKHTREKKLLWLRTKNSWIVYYWDNRTKIKTFTAKKYKTKERAKEHAKIFLESLPDIGVIEMTVNDYLKLPKNIQENLACYRTGIDEWPEYKNCELSINPWLLGAWLGNGNSDGKSFTNTDDECIRFFSQYLEQMECRLEKKEKPKFRYVIKNKIDRKRSPFKHELFLYNLINNKHIPDEYMFSDRSSRLDLLAGLIDTVGSLQTNRNTFQISQSREQLAKQICFLARSLGFSCSIKYYSQTKLLHANKDYKPYKHTSKMWRCHIGGNIEDIPCRILRKRANAIVDRQYDPLLMKMKITPVGEKDFYGFELTGNRRFLLGDFTVTHNCQLPCIGSDEFCFESKKWDICIDKTIYLTEIMRQKNKEFQECLDNIRLGLITDETRKLLESRINVEIKNEHGIRPTKLYCTNYSVDYINNEELDKLAVDDPDFYEYNMETHVFPGVKNRAFAIEKYKKNCNAPETIQLCTGAQVMLLCNLDLDGGLVNGSRGVIKGFVGDVPIVKFMNGSELVIDHHTWEIEENGKKVMRVIQIPLKLAYALTAHKSQGCTLDCVEIDMTNVFDYGQAYVMLSRVKNIENLNILGIDFDKIKAHPKAVNFYQSL